MNKWIKEHENKRQPGEEPDHVVPLSEPLEDCFPGGGGGRVYLVVVTPESGYR